MAVFDEKAGELNLKIVLYGPGLAGKTTNLTYVHAQANPRTRSAIRSVTTETERTLLFDYLPENLPPLRQYAVRLHLLTLPGPVFYDLSHRKALEGASGVVFVADSQEVRREANLESLEQLEGYLEANDRQNVPVVVQYNKRDLPGLISVEELDRVLRRGRPRFLACARVGEGVLETVEACAVAAVRSPETSHLLAQVYR